MGLDGSISIHLGSRHSNTAAPLPGAAVFKSHGNQVSHDAVRGAASCNSVKNITLAADRSGFVT
jgi:hypothetical protein